MSKLRPRLMRAGVLCVALPLAGTAPSVSAEERPGRRLAASNDHPIAFEPTEGRSHPSVRYVARGVGHAVFLTDDGAVIALPAGDRGGGDFRAASAGNGEEKDHLARALEEARGLLPEGVLDLFSPVFDVVSAALAEDKGDQQKESVSGEGDYQAQAAPPAENRPGALRMRLVGADPGAKARAGDRLPGRVNDLRGRDPKQWRRGIPTFGRVTYSNVYPGVGLVWHGRKGRLEHDFVVAPGTDPGVITLAFEGARSVTLDGAGDLVLGVDGGDVRLRRPELYQETGGERRPVEGAFRLLPEGKVGFAVGAYDPTLPLVIDPVLEFSTFLGGSGDDLAGDMATDDEGNVYVVGTTVSTDFPLEDALDNSLALHDAFVTKLSEDGEMRFSTFLGGSSTDFGAGVDVNEDGDVVVAGTTLSSDFPLEDPFDNSLGGSVDAFVTRLDDDLDELQFSTYLGGADAEITGFFLVLGSPVAIDEDGGAVITGWTLSGDFPLEDAFDNSLGGLSDAFVTRFADGGEALEFSTFLGGGAIEIATAVTLDDEGRAAVVGTTQSNDFPLDDPFQATTDASDAFVTRFTENGDDLEFSSYLGGGQEDVALGVAVDDDGQLSVTGVTASSAFPLEDPLDPLFQSTEAFLTTLDAGGEAIAFSTFLGGTGDDLAFDVAADPEGQVSVGGATDSGDFPLVTPLDATLGGPADGFLTAIDDDGDEIEFSTFLGGTDEDVILGVALEEDELYAAGATASADFPTQNAFDNSLNTIDAFVVKLE